MSHDELPPRVPTLIYSAPHSRGLNHIWDLFGVVRDRIPEDDELADDALLRIWKQYHDYRTRALFAEAQLAKRKRVWRNR